MFTYLCIHTHIKGSFDILLENKKKKDLRIKNMILVLQRIAVFF